MTFNEICKDFNERRPGTEIGIKPFVSLEWNNGDMSSNDLLRRYLIENKIEYLNDFNGAVWFLFDGDWTRCKVKSERKNGDLTVAHFSRCIFLDRKGA